MIELNKLIRPNIAALKPYQSARDDFNGTARVSLDANENPFGFGLNRYPDASMQKLKDAFGSFRSVSPDRLIFGNGSDEIIDLLIRTFCEPGKDKIMVFPPTFGMYEVCAAVNQVEVVKCQLNESFQIDLEKVEPSLSDPGLKLVFICSPNNPTGNKLDKGTITSLCEKFKGLVVVDEAYADFSDETLVTDPPENLVIMQTFSKALGLAGVRLGVGIAATPIIGVLNKVKPPYNVNSLTEQKAIEALQRPEEIRKNIEILLSERERIQKELNGISSVTKVFPSDSNFLLVEFKEVKKTYEQLLGQGIIVRDRSSHVPDTLRITIGTPEENNELIAALKGESFRQTGRIGECIRTTGETEIRIKVNLDDASNAVISTGISFFDHMLDQIGRHGGIGLSVLTKGDLKIDAHHTIEDTALALGTAFNDALKDRKGIERYGFLLPMDDCLAQIAIDFGGRPWIEWQAEFNSTQVGEMPTEMVYHFFKSFSDTARCNLNIKAEGDNDHHKIESIFKAFARALKMAVRRDESGLLPSTKGVL